MSELTLTDFLLTRIAEDEERAGAAIAGDEQPWLPAGALRGPAPKFIARHDPARVLAECEAKRRIVDVAKFAPEGPAGWGFRRILCVLAVPYADHPDYREEWKP